MPESINTPSKGGSSAGVGSSRNYSDRDRVDNSKGYEARDIDFSVIAKDIDKYGVDGWAIKYKTEHQKVRNLEKENSYYAGTKKDIVDVLKKEGINTDKIPDNVINTIYDTLRQNVYSRGLAEGHILKTQYDDVSGFKLENLKFGELYRYSAIQKVPFLGVNDVNAKLRDVKVDEQNAYFAKGVKEFGNTLLDAKNHNKFEKTYGVKEKDVSWGERPAQSYYDRDGNFVPSVMRFENAVLRKENKTFPEKIVKYKIFDKKHHAKQQDGILSNDIADVYLHGGIINKDGVAEYYVYHKGLSESLIDNLRIGKDDMATKAYYSYENNPNNVIESFLNNSLKNNKDLTLYKYDRTKYVKLITNKDGVIDDKSFSTFNRSDIMQNHVKTYKHVDDKVLNEIGDGSVVKVKNKSGSDFYLKLTGSDGQTKYIKQANHEKDFSPTVLTQDEFKNQSKEAIITVANVNEAFIARSDLNIKIAAENKRKQRLEKEAELNAKVELKTQHDEKLTNVKDKALKATVGIATSVDVLAKDAKVASVIGLDGSNVTIPPVVTKDVVKEQTATNVAKESVKEQVVTSTVQPVTVTPTTDTLTMGEKLKSVANSVVEMVNREPYKGDMPINNVFSQKGELYNNLTTEKLKAMADTIVKNNQGKEVDFNGIKIPNIKQIQVLNNHWSDDMSYYVDTWEYIYTFEKGTMQGSVDYFQNPNNKENILKNISDNLSNINWRKLQNGDDVELKKLHLTTNLSKLVFNTNESYEALMAAAGNTKAILNNPTKLEQIDMAIAKVEGFSESKNNFITKNNLAKQSLAQYNAKQEQNIQVTSTKVGEVNNQNTALVGKDDKVKDSQLTANIDNNIQPN